jgi:hypothetical protein
MFRFKIPPFLAFFLVAASPLSLVVLPMIENRSNQQRRDARTL